MDSGLARKKAVYTPSDMPETSSGKTRSATLPAHGALVGETQSSAVPDTPADTFDARFGDFSARPRRRCVRIRICSALSHLPRIYARAAAGGKGDANNPTAALDERHTGPLATRLPQPTTMDACA
jgi:hypothetical protein